MKLKQKNKIISLVLFGSLFAFSACNDSKKQEPCEISFSWWGNDSRHEYTLKGIEEFHSLYPEITIKPEYAVWNGYEEKFENQFKEGTNTDVMQINFDWLYKYSPNGNGFFDLSGYRDIIEFHNFTLTDLDFGIINGKINAISVGFNTIIPVFDGKMLSQNGLSIPSTWTEVISCGKVLKKKNQYLIGVNAKHCFLLAIAWFEQTHSKKFFVDNYNLNVSEEELGEILDFMKMLIKEHVIYPGITTFNAKILSGRQIAGAVAWCNEASVLARTFESLGGEGVLGSFISTKDAVESGWYIKPVSMYAIKKGCTHPKEAAALVNFLLNNPTMALLQKCDKGVPASNKSLTTLMEYDALESLQYNSLMKIRFNSANINAMLPIMENKDLNYAFAQILLAYTENKSSKSASAHALYERTQELLKH